MPSPSGILKLYTDEELQELLASVKERLKYGDFTSMSGGGKSHTLSIVPADKLLLELTSEIERRSGRSLPAKIYQNNASNRVL